MEDNSKKTNAEKRLVQSREIAVELPEILDKVPYLYVNHARLSSNKWDIRIAFGEIGATGHLEPRCGVILPHVTAKGLAAALDRVVKAVEQRIGEIVDPDQSKSKAPNRKTKPKVTKVRSDQMQ
jgi:hypothetical protein